MLRDEFVKARDHLRTVVDARETEDAVAIIAESLMRALTAVLALDALALAPGAPDRPGSPDHPERDPARGARYPSA